MLKAVDAVARIDRFFVLKYILWCQVQSGPGANGARRGTYRDSLWGEIVKNRMK